MTEYLTYALNKEGDLVHIDSVANGNACECFCPRCNSELCAKNGGTGEKMIHHFAHVSGSDCVGAVESALHIMAKNVMKEMLCIQLPDRANGEKGELLKLDRVEIEFYDKETRLRPDCIGYYGDKVIWIEFKRTHEVDKKKKGKIISAKIDCIELDINNCALNEPAVRKFITEDKEHRIWIRDKSFKQRSAGVSRNGNSSSNYDHYAFQHVQRFLAKDENGYLVNLKNEDFDMNIHSYYCLACGKELTIDINEYGEYVFEHIDSDVHCEDDFYLHNAAKEIIYQKFNSEKEFVISIAQFFNCEENSNCMFYHSETCLTERRISYDLKKYGYTECLKNYKLPEFRFKCNLLIKRKDDLENAIIVSLNSGKCHVDVKTEKYRVIEIFVDEYSLSKLLNSNIDEDIADFIGFHRDGCKTAPRSKMKRKILSFSLFSSGKYHLHKVLCSKADISKKSTVWECYFDEDQIDFGEAMRYCLLKCYKQKRNACYCEICAFKRNISSYYVGYVEICIRYKTKGTPHYPLDEKPINCKYFRLDENIEKSNSIEDNVRTIEKEYE